MFHDNFNEILNTDFTGVDLIYFGGNMAQKEFNIDKEILEKYWEPSPQSKNLFERKTFVTKVEDIFCTLEAYAINKRTAKILTKKYRTNLIIKHIDHIIEDIKCKKTSDIADQIKMFNYFPIVCYQGKEMGTDIWEPVLTKKQLFLKKLRKLIPLPPLKTLQSLQSYFFGYLKFKSKS
jgi:hypothetical protein